MLSVRIQPSSASCSIPGGSAVPKLMSVKRNVYRVKAVAKHESEFRLNVEQDPGCELLHSQQIFIEGRTVVRNTSSDEQFHLSKGAGGELPTRRSFLMLSMAVVAGGFIPPVLFPNAVIPKGLSAYAEGAADMHEDETTMIIFERGEMSVPNAMIELPHNYRFSYPSTWRSEIVSRNDSNAYGMDTHMLSVGEGEIMVNLLPYNGKSPDGKAVASFLNNASMSVSLSLMDATQISATEEVKDQSNIKYWIFEYDHPNALVAATIVDSVLYVMSARASSSRQWNKIHPLLRHAVSSFTVPE